MNDLLSVTENRLLAGYVMSSPADRVNELADQRTAFVGLLEDSEVSGFGDVVQGAVGDVALERFGVGARSDDVFFAEEQQRRNVEGREQGSGVWAFGHTFLDSGDALCCHRRSHRACLSDEIRPVAARSLAEDSA